MAKLLLALAGAFVGLIVGYYVGAEINCARHPESNLCGLFGAFYTGPAGAIVGAVVGWLIGARRPRRPRP